VTENEITARDDGVFAVSGRVTFQTVPQFLGLTKRWLQSGNGRVTIDMQAVTLVDSAGLALMIEWLQLARTANREIGFTNIPGQMRDLIRVNGLEQVFQLD